MRNALIHALLLGVVAGGTAVSGAACQNSKTHRERASLAYGHGDLAAAVDVLRRAVSECPGEPFLQFMLGNALYRGGDIKKAAAAYESSLRLDDSYFEAWTSAGFARLEIGPVETAVGHFTRAVRLDQNSAFARAGLAVALLAAGDTPNALSQYDHARRLNVRYGAPDLLAIDIRWKKPFRAALTRLLQQEPIGKDQ